MDAEDPNARLLTAALILHARKGDQRAVHEMVNGWDLGERDAVLYALLGIAANHLPVSDRALEIYLLGGAKFGG